MPTPKNARTTRAPKPIKKQAGKPSRKPVSKPHATRPAKADPVSRTDPAVDAFLLALDHPLRPALEALRQLILAVSPAVREEFKWNSPSFRTTEHFATANLQGPGTLRLILHRGAKKRADAMPEIPDPAGLLKWLGRDRAMVLIKEPAGLGKLATPLKAILKHWIRHV